MHRLCVLFVLAIPALGSAQSGATPDRTSRVAWLQANAIPVRSVDPADTDFADLAPFGKAIGNARIVMLGEQSHGDGTVFLAKTRLIRYLHEVLGFDVLAFEGGIYDTQKAWEFVQNGEAPFPAIRRSMSGFWTYSEQFLPLMEYLGSRAKASRPLELSGFDYQTHASQSGDFWISDLLTFLYTHNVALPSNWAAGRPVLDSLLKYLYRPKNPASPAQQQALAAVLDSISASVASLPSSDRTVAFWQQNLKSFRAHAARALLYNPEPKAFQHTDNNPRDAQMADNLIWLAQKRYPDRKIIVWAATYHNIRNPGIIGDSGTYVGLRTMGHIAWEALGTQIYSLGFVASEGKKGALAQQLDVPTPDPQSLDGLLASTKHDFAIVDFKHLPAGAHWLRERMVSGPLGYSPQKADWTQILDGVMYTRTMRPSTRATR